MQENSHEEKRCPEGHLINDIRFPCILCKAQKNKRISEAKERASERMQHLCSGCAYRERIECPLESVQDIETLNALVPEGCKKWKSRYR